MKTPKSRMCKSDAWIHVDEITRKLQSSADRRGLKIDRERMDSLKKKMWTNLEKDFHLILDC